MADVPQSARDTEKCLLSYQVPSQDMVENAADPLMTMADLPTVARIYRLKGLLELYGNCPELLDSSSETTTEIHWCHPQRR
jgi:hypothetical protein